MTNTIQYGDHSIDVSALPNSTVFALIRRGVSHVLGNEAASKVAAFVEAQAKLGVILAEDEKALKKAEFQLAFVQAMQNGTLGQGHARGPKTDPVESAAIAIAKREVSDTLRGAGVKAPKGDTKIETKNGSYTMAELVQRRLESPTHGDRIRKEAAKHVAELEKKAKKARELAQNAGSVEAALDL